MSNLVPIIPTCDILKEGTSKQKVGTKEFAQTVALLGRVLDQGIEIVKTENLHSFDGKPGYTLAQGQ